MNRSGVNRVLWVLRSGAHWHDLPERYGKWKSIHTRFSRWAKAGVWERVFEALIRDPSQSVGQHMDPGGQSSSGTRQPIPHARHHPGSRPPAGGDPKRGAKNQALGRNCRLSRPLRPGSPALPGSRSFTRSHCRSESSHRLTIPRAPNHLIRSTRNHHEPPVRILNVRLDLTLGRPRSRNGSVVLN
jgi:hypothetical protein